MDGLSESFGQLSTQAKEWRPGSQFGAPTSNSSNTASTTTTTMTTSVTRNNAGHVPLSPLPPNSAPVISSVLQHTPPGRSTWKRSPVPSSGASNDWGSPVTEFIPGAGWGQQQQQQQQQQQHLHQSQPSSQHPQVPNLWGDGGPDEEGPLLKERMTPQDGSRALPTSIPAVPGPPAMRSLHSLGLLDEHWRYYRSLSLESQKELDPNDPRHKAVPPNFTNVMALDAAQSRSTSSFGYPIATFKVVSREDGHFYCIRRADNVRGVSHKIAAAVTERWNTATTSNAHFQMGRHVIDHPNVVKFYRCFLANRAVFFLHQYHPGARSLRERFFSHNSALPPLSEPVIWSCITQLVTAMCTIHGGNLACRTLQLNHILCNGEDRLRLRINCLGVVDALEFESRKPMLELQREDMRDLGRIIMSLTTGTEITRASDGSTIRQCDIFVAQNYSRELYNLMVQLLLPNQHPPSIYNVASSISAHVLAELEMQQVGFDRTETALASEYDSGRALRLLLKMGFVNDRPEFGLNRRWTESGESYVIKLFRDYVFHQADGNGMPIMDLGHVITSLNKLDAADEERIVLPSRDGKTLMVVSYGDVARALENAYGELCHSSLQFHHHHHHHHQHHHGPQY